MVLLVDERPEEVTDMRRWHVLERRGRGVDLRPPGRGAHPGRRAHHRAGQAPGRGRAGRRDHPRRHHPPGPGLQPGRAGHRAGSCPAASTPARSTRRRSSSAPPATSRRAARSPSSPPRSSRPGSKMDEVIFEEFKGTGNMELRLDRRLAERRIYPAIDVDASSTRHEELLFDRKQLQQVWELRRVLSGLSSSDGGNAAALELLIDRMKTFRTNDEFLAEIAKNQVGRGLTVARRLQRLFVHQETHHEGRTSTPTTSRRRCAARAATRSRPARPSSDLRVELCSECHPFYTGKQKLVDTGGRIDRFERRYGKRKPRSPRAGPDRRHAVRRSSSPRRADGRRSSRPGPPTAVSSAGAVTSRLPDAAGAAIDVERRPRSTGRSCRPGRRPLGARRPGPRGPRRRGHAGRRRRTPPARSGHRVGAARRRGRPGARPRPGLGRPRTGSTDLPPPGRARADAAGVLARQAGLFATAPAVWAVDGTTLAPAERGPARRPGAGAGARRPGRPAHRRRARDRRRGRHGAGRGQRPRGGPHRPRPHDGRRADRRTPASRWGWARPTAS